MLERIQRAHRFPVAASALCTLALLVLACNANKVNVGEDNLTDGGSNDTTDSTGSTDDNGEPREAGPIPTLPPGARTIFSGTYRACALQPDGVYCWGMIGDFTYNAIYSQVDHPPQTSGHVPGGNAIRIPQLDDAVELAMSEGDTCLRTSSNDVYCYTADLFKGGDPAPRSMGKFTSIVGGDFAVCGISAEGTVSCWGDATPRQGTADPPMPGKDPVVVAGLSDVVEIASGGKAVCARRKDGSVGCWSEWGNNDPSWPTATDTTKVTGATRIAVGYVHACAVVSDTLSCWGANTLGELGTGYTDNDDRPISKSLFKGVPHDIALGTAESCALDSTGLAFCWGAGSYVGSDRTAVKTPEAVRLGEQYSEISTGEWAFCARRVGDKAVRCWRPQEEPKDVIFHVAGTPFTGGTSDGG